MNSESYWAKRNEQREEQWHKKAKNTIEKELAKYYEQALSHIQDDIAILFGRYAKDNALSLQEATKLLSGKEFRTWRMSMQEYIDKYESDKDDKLLLELNTLVMRKRISRLDKLYSDTLKNLHTMGVQVDLAMSKFLGSAYKDNYYHNLFDIAQKASIKSSIAEVDSGKLKKVLQNPWSGKNYSERIWKNTDKLAKLIRDEVVNGVHRGITINKMAKLIQERMDVGKNEAIRLVKTEMNYVQNQSALDSIKDSEMQYYIFLATLDKRTSTICRSHDRKVYPVKDAQPGTNMPPLHPNCRSTIAGSLKSVDTGRGKRIGKDADGKRVIVPASMRYDDFYKIYIKKTQTLSEWEKSNKSKPKKNDIINNTHTIINGENVTGKWKRRPKQFKNEIDDIVNYQGFDGLPRLIQDKEEFLKLVNEDHFIGKRVYTAKTQEQLNQYANDLRYGKWYIDCSVGGAQFGQGMYCSSDYTKGSRIKEVDSIMDYYYINEYSRHDKKFYKVETLALDKTAKILYVPRERVFSGMPLIKTIAKTYVKNNPEEFGLLYIDLTNVNRLNEEEFNLYKSAYIKKADEILLKKLNIAVIATQLGYDAIKVERRSSDLPHTIILNRTKIIIFEGDFNE